MSRNSIRLIKGQNRIELIYRVNSESLKMKEKKKKAYELDFFWHTNCLWTEEEPYSLSSGNLLPRWLGEEVPTETAPVVSMINIFLFAPVTTPPLNANYFSEVLSQIQSFYAKKGRLGAPPPRCCDALRASEKTHRDPSVLFWLQTCFIFAGGGRATCCLVTSQSAPLVWEFWHYLPFQGLLGEKKCAISLHQEFNLWRDVLFFFFDVPLFC